MVRGEYVRETESGRGRVLVFGCVPDEVVPSAQAAKARRDGRTRCKSKICWMNGSSQSECVDDYRYGCGIRVFDRWAVSSSLVNRLPGNLLSRVPALCRAVTGCAVPLEH